MAAASDPVVILSAARTPLGRFMGELPPFSAHKLGAHVIGAALERAKLAPEKIDEVFMGNVLPAGQGQAWRRLRTRPSHWRHRRAIDRDAFACPRSAEPQTRRRGPVHRWR